MEYPREDAEPEFHERAFCEGRTDVPVDQDWVGFAHGGRRFLHRLARCCLAEETAPALIGSARRFRRELLQAVSLCPNPYKRELRAIQWP